LGHNAFSCDIQETSGGHPEWHIKGDVLAFLNPAEALCCGSKAIAFDTTDGKPHIIPDKWDLIIAHPPCTRLCSSGQRWLYYGDSKYREAKKIEQKCAIEFFMQFVNADCDRIAIENPVGIMSTLYRKPDCVYNPFDFEGETECKKSCLWLKNLPKLKPTQILPKDMRTNNLWKAHFNGKCYSWSDKEVAKFRSKTPLGVAEAMAKQWSAAVLAGYTDKKQLSLFEEG
jgi:hypothetical protein